MIARTISRSQIAIGAEGAQYAYRLQSAKFDLSKFQWVAIPEHEALRKARNKFIRNRVARVID